MKPQSARELRNQCKPLGIPLFLKQWGTYASNPLVCEDRNPSAQLLDPASNGKGGALLDGRLWRGFPVPKLRVADRPPLAPWVVHTPGSLVPFIQPQNG